MATKVTVKQSPTNTNIIKHTEKKHLVIVESPAKCTTISKYLGENFTVMASYGHISELEKKNMGIDIENNYTPQYNIHPDKKKIVSALKSAMKKVDQVWIATDEDREGEAIGWHVANALNLDIEKTPRITFHEITKTALEHAIGHPRTIDMNLVNAQQARRILDRLVGFELSPLLRKKVQSGLSAGRVQSVAVRLLVDREREIEDFSSQSTLQSQAIFSTENGDFIAKGDVSYTSIEDARNFIKQSSESTFQIKSVTAKPSKKNPSSPFTTSTLQQEASRKLGFSVSQTMRVAQKLYEAGFITYMRTDSIIMSSTAISGAVNAIENRFGKENILVRKFSNKKTSSQEAHECIRPTDFMRETAGEDRQAQRLYHLIRQRSIASQMIEAKCEKTTIKISLSESKDGFTANGEVIQIPGFLLAYGIDGKTMSKTEYEDGEEKGDSDVSNQGLPVVNKGDVVGLQKLTITTHYDRHPARYTEASLVKKMEAEGIGRPSTYAPTISTIIKRNYVILEDREGVIKDFQKLELSRRDNSTEDIIEKSPMIQNLLFDYQEEVLKKPYGAERRKLFPTDTGVVVTDFLIDHFPDIVNYGFTASIEQEFDEIAEKGRDWRSMMDSFYKPFHALIVQAGGDAPRASGERILGLDTKTGKKVSVRLGRYGPFVQLGESEDTDKKYASLKTGLRLGSITLEEAISCFDLPRKLGSYNQEYLLVNIGRFGPYVKRGSLFVSLPKDKDPYSLTTQEAQELVDQKIQSDKEKIIHRFVYTDSTECVVEKGRYGPFIRYGKLNIKISKDIQEKINTTSDTERIHLVDENKETAAKPKRSRKKK